MSVSQNMATNSQQPRQRVSLSQAMKAANAHAQAGRLVQAEGILRQILQQRPNDTEALHQLGIIAYRAGKMPVAIQLIERALTVNPDVHVMRANLAEMYRRTGQVKKAIEYGTRAVALKPDAPDAQNNLGIAYFDAGDYEAAVRCYDNAIAARPRFPEAFSNRGNALRNLRRFTDAEADYRRALAINPNYAEALNNLGSVLRDLDRPAEAEQAYKRALALKPQYLEAANNLILAYKDLRRYDEALAAVEAALKIQPQNPDALAYAGAVYTDQKKTELALAALQKALALQPNKPETLNLLGRAYLESGNPQKTVEFCERAIALRPAVADPYNNMGNALKELGRFDEAMAAFEKALSLAPNETGIYANLSDAKKFTSRDDRHLRAVEELLKTPHTEERQMHLHFAAAKALDDLKAYDEAFPHFLKGNAIKRKSIGYDETAALAYMERIRTSFTAEVAAKKVAGFADRTPILVVGMPRSGTTLIEQIVASHPRVAGGGELRDLADTANNVRNADGSAAPYPEFMAVISEAELARVGEAYVAKLRRHAPSAERITDKMPSNFYFVGLVHMALPGARIIHANRNAVDTCLSCFTKLFSGELNQCYDLGEVGRFYRAYHRLMAHWRDVLPANAFLDVQYEEVVADTEGQARRILDYCGLEWDPAVLEFHRNTRPVRTASSSQVRQPIYNSSVARWRNYEKFLGPLLAELGDLAR